MGERSIPPEVKESLDEEFGTVLRDVNRDDQSGIDTENSHLSRQDDTPANLSADERKILAGKCVMRGGFYVCYVNGEWVVCS